MKSFHKMRINKSGGSISGMLGVAATPAILLAMQNQLYKKNIYSRYNSRNRVKTLRRRGYRGSRGSRRR